MEKSTIGIITYYEILSGLKHKDLVNRAKEFEEFCELNRVLPLTKTSVAKSAEIYAKLRKKGTPADEIDILIAGIALDSDLQLITNNQRDFEKIDELDIADWSN